MRPETVEALAWLPPASTTAASAQAAAMSIQ
jgi:hypothetical protein